MSPHRTTNDDSAKGVKNSTVTFTSSCNPTFKKKVTVLSSEDLSSREILHNQDSDNFAIDTKIENDKNLSSRNFKSTSNGDSKPPLKVNFQERKGRVSRENAVVTKILSYDKHDKSLGEILPFKSCSGESIKSPERHITLYEFPVSPPSDSSKFGTPEKRMISEKRKIRGNGLEETEEKRRSCEAESESSSLWKTSRQPLALGAG